eukprot:scaffold39_cov66-Phaeocystis_antarctica.AAC.5
MRSSHWQTLANLTISTSGLSGSRSAARLAIVFFCHSLLAFLAAATCEMSNGLLALFSAPSAASSSPVSRSMTRSTSRGLACGLQFASLTMGRAGGAFKMEVPTSLGDTGGVRCSGLRLAVAAAAAAWAAASARALATSSAADAIDCACMVAARSTKLAAASRLCENPAGPTDTMPARGPCHANVGKATRNRSAVASSSDWAVASNAPRRAISSAPLAALRNLASCKARLSAPAGRRTSAQTLISSCMSMKADDDSRAAMSARFSAGVARSASAVACDWACAAVGG